MNHAFARSGDVQIAYTVEGEGDETVLLVIGLGGRASDWGRAFPARLAERYRVVRVDNRGVGASPKAPGGYTLSDLATDATRVLDAVGAERAHIVGLSMGGMISQLLALEHPDRVDHLVLLSTHVGGPTVEPPHPDAMRLFDPGEFLRLGRDAGAMMRATLDVITAPGFPARSPSIVDEMVANARNHPTPPSAFMAQLQAIIGSDRSERLRDISKPTLVVHGAEDKLIPPSNGRRLAELIPGARLQMLEKVGHMPMIEIPDDLARIVTDFLSTP